MKNKFLCILPILLTINCIQISYANDVILTPPVLQDISGNVLPLRNVLISTTIQYDAGDYGNCLQSQQSMDENNAFRKSIYILKNQYREYLSGILWEKYSIPFTRCEEDSDAMRSDTIYPMLVYVNYSIGNIQKQLNAYTKWKIRFGISNPTEVLVYPTGYFSTRSTSSDEDIVWYSNGKVGTYDEYSSSYVPSFDIDNTTGYFSTTGSMIGSGIMLPSSKEWSGMTQFFTEKSDLGVETIRFIIPREIPSIQGTFEIFSYPGGENIVATLYSKGKFVKLLRRNIDFWVRPSKIEAGKYIIFHPEKFYPQLGDEIRVHVTPIVHSYPFN